MSDGLFVELNELIFLKNLGFGNKLFKPKKTSHYDGSYTSKIRGRGMEFAEVRNYQPGDEVKHIHWGITARTGRPHIKLFEQERDRPIVLLVDFNQTMYFGTKVCLKSVVAARLAAYITWVGLNNGDKVGGFFFSPGEQQEFLPMAKEKSVLPMLKSLSDFTKQYNQVFHENEDALNNALIKVRRILRPGSILIIISDLYQCNANTLQNLRPLCMHNDIFLFHVLDQLELTPPEPDCYAVTDGAEQMLMDTTENQNNVNFSHYLNNKINRYIHDFQQLRVNYNQITSETNLKDLTKVFMKDSL